MRFSEVALMEGELRRSVGSESGVCRFTGDGRE